jgi:hypothetical protein
MSDKKDEVSDFSLGLSLKQKNEFDFVEEQNVTILIRPPEEISDNSGGLQKELPRCAITCNKYAQDILKKKSEYLSTLFNMYLDQDNKIIEMYESNTTYAIRLIMELAWPTHDKLVWNKEMAGLSAKWIVADMIEKFTVIAIDILQKFKPITKIRISNLDLNDDIDYNGLYDIVPTCEIQNIQEARRRCDNGTTIRLHRIDIFNGRYNISRTNWELCVSNQNELENENFMIPLKTVCGKSHDVPHMNEIHKTYGQWYRDDESSKIIHFNIENVKIFPFIPLQQDIDMFCEVVEVFLCHECYATSPLSNIDDLFEIILYNRYLLKPEILQRLLNTEDMLKFSLFSANKLLCQERFEVIYL